MSPAAHFYVTETISEVHSKTQTVTAINVMADKIHT